MDALFYYLTYPLIYVVASLPFWALYKVSDLLFHLLWLSGYRKAVVFNNLKNSFPAKTIDEIKVMQKQYYRYLCDLIFETLKTLTMTEDEARQRCFFHRQEWLDTLHDQKKSII